eukprot:3831073-Prymnesium_polylepis.2
MHECARLRLDERIASAARGTRIALKPCSFIQDADASREAACDPPMKHTCDSMPNHETPLMTKPVGSPASPQAGGVPGGRVGRGGGDGGDFVRPKHPTSSPQSMHVSSVQSGSLHVYPEHHSRHPLEATREALSRTTTVAKRTPGDCILGTLSDVSPLSRCALRGCASLPLRRPPAAGRPRCSGTVLWPTSIGVGR